VSGPPPGALPRGTGRAVVGAPAAAGPSAFRWAVLAFAVTATALNYVDRQLIALVKPLLERELHWTDLDYAHIVSGFQFAVALSCLFAGWAIDRLGLRLGYALAVGIWSLASMAHAGARSVVGFVAARLVLGVAESGNTPGAMKSVAAWFPVRERSLAVGFTNAGANLGAIVTPLLVPLLVAVSGWRGAFLITGAAGLVWVGAWLAFGPKPPPAAAAVSAPGPGRTPAPPGPSIAALLRDRRTWAFAGAKGLSDPVWWFFLFWFPDLLSRNYGLSLRTFGPPLAIVYTMATVGALAGGWLPGWLLARGWSLNAARKSALLIAAAAILPVPLALGMQNYWYVIALVGLALAAHQSYSTNLFAFAQDVFPRSVVGTVVGIGATLGSAGGLVMLEVTGWVLTRTHLYWPMFTYCAAAYVAGLVLLHSLVPRIEACAPHASDPSGPS
jgi:MFS transporter, ACS family, hexuronate transporter